MSTAPSHRFDRRALWDGISVAAFLAVPIQIVARLAVDENKRSGWTALVTVLILGALILGAGVAAWRQTTGTPLSHGIVTAAGTFLVVQAVFTLIKAIQGSHIFWGRIVISLGFSLVAGVIGGFLGSALIRRGVQSQR
jgi:hypothetical protein